MILCEKGNSVTRKHFFQLYMTHSLAVYCTVEQLWKLAKKTKCCIMAWIKQAKGDFSLGVFLPIPKSGRNGSLDDKWTFGWCWKGFCVVQFSATSASLHIIFIWEFLIQAKNYCRYIGTSSAVVLDYFIKLSTILDIFQK